MLLQCQVQPWPQVQRRTHLQLLHSQVQLGLQQPHPQVRQLRVLQSLQQQLLLNQSLLILLIQPLLQDLIRQNLLITSLLNAKNSPH